MLSFAAVILTSIPVGGGNLEYDLVLCSMSASGVDLCRYVQGHGTPWVWLELESVTEQHSGETLSLSIKQLLPVNLAVNIVIWFLPLLILLSLKGGRSL